MKRCPKCNLVEHNDALKYCRTDGTRLVAEALPSDSTATAILHGGPRNKEISTRLLQSTPSTAVLPFANLSADPENEYFCDGLAEELLNALAKVEGLKVAARTSAFSFKGRNTNIGEIGRALNVSTVLEGSVRKAGNRLRITVQLISVADGYHLWSERYDRQLEDIFDVQDDITLAVVDALKVKLLGEEREAVLKRYTDNTEAYELYLRGLYYLNKFTGPGWLRGIEYFQQATHTEPEYAPAYARIADCYNYLSLFGLSPSREIISQWRAAARRALEIDDDLAEGHLSLAFIRFYYEWDWAGAEREYRRAVQLNPNSAEAHQFYGMFLVSRERFAEAIGEGKRAVELDPLSLFARLVLGTIYLFSDRLEDALRQARQMVELEPDFHGAYWLMGTVSAARGRYEEAIEAYRRAEALAGNQVRLAQLGCAYALAGRRDEALGVLHQLLETREREYAAAFNVARVYAGLGEADKAFEWMGKAVEERNGELVHLDRFVKIGTGELLGRTFRTDPRLQDILRRIGLLSGESRHDQPTVSQRGGGLAG